MRRERVIDDGRRLVPKTPSSAQYPITEFRVLAAGFRTRWRTQIGAKSADLFKELFAKSQVGAEWSIGQLARLWAKIEHGQRRQCIFACHREPSRWCEIAFRQNTSS